jgi:hypothetical protein
MAKLKIIGWRYGLQKITMTKLLRFHLDLDLAKAKHITDDVLDGKHFEYEFDDIEKAKVLAAELNEIGVIVEIEE